MKPDITEIMKGKLGRTLQIAVGGKISVGINQTGESRKVGHQYKKSAQPVNSKGYGS
jgi:hypothetical protein